MESHNRCASWAADFDRAVSSCALLQARIRLEGPCLAPVELELKKACQLAQQADSALREKREQLLATWQEVVRISEDAENDQAARAAQVVQYQRMRRELMLCGDTLEADLGNALDTLTRLETNLETQRRAVAIAIRRVMLTQESLSVSRPPAAPGEPPAMFGDTNAIDLFTALSDFRTTQCNFMNVWLTHYAVRLRLYCEVGAIRIDEDGNWTAED